MSRRNTGTVRILRNEHGEKQWHAKWTLAGKERSEWAPIPDKDEPPIALDDKPAAQAYAARLAAKVRHASEDPSAETCTKYFLRLSDVRKSEGVRDTRHERNTWNKYMAPRIGNRPIVSVTRDEIELIRDYLDSRVRLRIKEGLKAGISGDTAANVWTVLRTTFKESVAARDRSLRLRTDDPTEGHKPPITTPDRQKTFVYPNEFAKLVACEAITLEWREVYAVAAYLYVRPEELQALEWPDVDFDAGTVSVSKAIDARTGKPKPLPKTASAVRDVPIDPELWPLLKRMYDEAKGNSSKAPTGPILPVLGTLNDKFRAKQFREHLEKADVTRARLFAETATLIPVNFRSCRDSGITWLALAGVKLEVIKRRAGHEEFETTDRYVKMAEDLGGKVGTPFQPLPPSLLQPSSRIAPKRPRGDSTGVFPGVYGAGGGNRTHGPESHETPGKQADCASDAKNETPGQEDRGGQSRTGKTDRRAIPLTAAELRAQLDAAIKDKAWPSVPIIHERLQLAERAESARAQHQKLRVVK